jgi:hypothetical protein
LWVIFALLNPDPDPLTRLNPDPIRIRIRNPVLKIENTPCVCRRAEPCGLGAGQILAKLVQLRESSRRRVTRTENRRIRRLNLEYLGRGHDRSPYLRILDLYFYFCNFLENNFYVFT